MIDFKDGCGSIVAIVMGILAGGLVTKYLFRQGLHLPNELACILGVCAVLIFIAIAGAVLRRRRQ